MNDLKKLSGSTKGLSHRVVFIAFIILPVLFAGVFMSGAICERAIRGAEVVEDEDLNMDEEIAAAIDELELDKEAIIDELLHIRRIDSDLARLNAYDSFVDKIVEKIEAEEERKEGIVAKYSGDDDKTTDLYEINAPWEVHWVSEGRIFQLYVYDEDDRRVEVAANKTRGGSDIYRNDSSGSYYLEVKATGDWNFTIKEDVDE